MPKFLLNKLVRDKLPFKGLISQDRIIETDQEFIAVLKEKLKEEVAEVLAAETTEILIDEISDVYEVFDNWIKTLGVSWETVHRKRLEKKEKRGGFESRIFGVSFELPADHPSLPYYRAQPEKYPEVEEVS